MESVLKKYKERQINISGRNRSLVTKKLYKKRAADLYRLSSFNKEIDIAILEYIKNRKEKQLEILKDHITYVQNEKKVAKKRIQDEQEKETSKILLKNKGLSTVEITKLKEGIENTYKSLLEKEYEQIDTLGEDIAIFSNSLTQLKREIQSVEKETGRYELYVGYPFVEGKFKDATFVKAPLFLFPVRIKEEKGNWYIENILSQDILLNKVLLLAASKYNKLDIDQIETEIKDITERFKTIEEVVEHLDRLGLHVEYSNKDIIQRFKETKKDDIDKYQDGELIINPYLILGQFSVANSIYDDYQKLERIYNGDSGEKNVLLDRLLTNEGSNDYDINPDNDYYRKRPLKEEDYHFITPLDYSQESALKKVNETDQLVIYGPPGTGKSQTIANIISDALAKDKKVLMVSQKRAAIDVIYNRLNELNTKSIIIHDTNKDKKDFYQKVSTSIEEIIQSSSIGDSEARILERAKYIDNKIDKLEALALTLSEKREFGLTLQQMYAMTKEIDSIEDCRYIEYRLYKDNRILNGYNYDEINSSIGSIKSSNVLKTYIKYKEYKSNAPEIVNLVDGLDKLDVQEYAQKIKEVKLKYNDNIYLSSHKDEYFKTIFSMYEDLQNKVSDERIESLAKDINKEKNSDLLNPLKKEDYIEQCEYKNDKYFNEFIELYNRIEDDIDEISLNQLSLNLNDLENNHLLKDLSRNDYLNQSKYKNNKYFYELFNLYNTVEDIISDYRINKLADEINENLNSQLLNKIDKDSHKDKYEINNKKHLEEFLKLYTTLEDIIDEDSIEHNARELNKKYNSNLLEPIDFGKWYTISYWKNKKSNEVKQASNKLEYEKKEENIKSLLNSYRIEIERYAKEIKTKNRDEYNSRREDIYNDLLSYKADIEKFAKETKENNQTEYERRYNLINRDIKAFKTDVEKYVEENIFKNKTEYRSREIDINNKLTKIRDEIEEFIEDTYLLTKIIKNGSKSKHKAMFESGENLIEYFNNIIDGLEVYEKYHDALLYIKRLTILDDKILNYVCDNKRTLEEIDILIDNIKEFEILLHINEIERQEKLDILLYEEFNDIIREVNDCLKVKQKLTPHYISNKIDTNFIDIKYNYTSSTRKELKRQADKKRMLWPIRQYLSTYTDLLLGLFPCWLLGPETVSEILPLKAGLFDIVIFDEASQMYIETAIPTVYRGKKVIIAGDDKQLRPSSTFKTKIEEGEEDESENAAALEEESLLDLAKVNYDSVHLNYHYRSKYDELINFSNYAFYNGKLEVSPNTTKTDISVDKPIERIKVNGRWLERKNKEEADEVVRLIKKILMTRKNNETIGVITFNTSQQNLIEDKLDYEASKDSGFRKLYTAERDRLEHNEDVSIFVKNIENVQGDERDIIIFSTGYAPNEKGKVSLNFGSLSQDGGENRLNVAISRAKQKIYVVTSIEPEELLNVENTKNNGPKLLKEYLKYVRSVSNGDKEEAQIILNSLQDTDISRSQAVIFDSPFEEEVYDALIKSGFDVDTQIGVSGYKIDLGIYDSKTSKYILGIECDGAAYHSSKYARERDIHRQRYLESRGWKIVRIWSRDWWKNPSSEIEKIKQMIENIKNDLPIRQNKKRAITIENEVGVNDTPIKMYSATKVVKNLEINKCLPKDKREGIEKLLTVINNKINKDNNSLGN